MFKNIRGFFQGKESLAVDRSGAPSIEALRLAAAGLMVEAAMADSSFDESELRIAVQAISDEFHMTAVQADEMLHVAADMHRSPEKLSEFIAAIVEHFDVSQRERLMSLVWRVIMADNILGRAESEIAIQLRTRLGLTLEQAMRAQAMAIDGDTKE